MALVKCMLCSLCFSDHAVCNVLKVPFTAFAGLLLPFDCFCFDFHEFLLQGKRTNLRKTGSERIAHGMRVKFNPLALLLDSSLEGEFDLVQRIIYEVWQPSWRFWNTTL